jgi:hypothetical protein
LIGAPPVEIATRVLAELCDSDRTEVVPIVVERPAILSVSGAVGATVRSVENRASLTYRSMCDQVNLVDLNDLPDEVEYEHDLAENFKRIDRRRLIAAPEANRAEFQEQLRAWTQINGEQPRWNLKEVFETAGERLACCRLAIEFSDGTSSEQIQVLLFDQSVTHLELIVSFDPDDVEMAIVELRRMAEEVKSASP